uniref:Uncharacterized protein n=1 Tax=Rhizophora mucronata TaxID=61149 RepID=A0A2P2KN58_RHIMU
MFDDEKNGGQSSQCDQVQRQRVEVEWTADNRGLLQDCI